MASKVVIEKKMPKPRLSLDKKMSMYGYLFISPIIIGYFLLYIPVLVQSAIYSFSSISFKPGEGLVTTGVGWSNYLTGISRDGGEFIRVLFNSTVALLPQIIIVLIFAFFMANLLNQKFHGRTITRVIFFLPVIMSTGIMAYVDSLSSMVDEYTSGGKLDVGGAGSMGGDMGMSKENMAFASSKLGQIISDSLNNEDLSELVMNAVTGVYGVLTSAGVQMLVFLSGLQSISVSMYEAAKVEGATGWEVFWKVSFPMISPLILVNLIYTVIDLFLTTDNEAISYINEALGSIARYGEASALSWMYTIVILLFVGIVFLLVKNLIIYQD